MTRQVPVSFRNHKKLLLRGVVHVPTHFTKETVTIIYLHGWPGTMEGSAKEFCTSLSALGYLCLRFSFSCTPPSEGVFEQKLMSDEAKDIGSAITFMKEQYPTKKLVVIGHSTGAIDAAVYAYSDRRITGLVLSGAVCHLDNAVRYDFTDRMVRDFWMKGYAYRLPVSDGKKRTYAIPNKGKIRKAFYDEFFTLDIPASMKKYKRPLLILHGEQDEAIPSEKDPVDLYKLANKPKKLVIIKGAKHSYESRKHHKQAVAAIAAFVKSLK